MQVEKRDVAYSTCFRVLTLCWLFSAFTLATFALPVFYSRGPGFDFEIYLSEGHHLIRGVDPYDVWVGKVHSEGFVPYERADLRSVPGNRMIHGHTPWAYAYFLPFSGEWSNHVKWRIWMILEAVSFVLVILTAFWYGRRLAGGVWGGLFVSAAAMSVGTTFTVMFGSGNYIFMVVAALACMLYCLCSGRDILAGVCWAVVVIKPQDGFLLAIPLLLARRWKTVFTAAAITLLAAFVSSCFVEKPMLELIMEVPKLKSVGNSAPLFHESVVDWLVNNGVSHDVIQYSNMLFGVSVCFVLSCLVRKSEDWGVRLLPAVICASFWTYMDIPDRSCFALLQMVFAVRALTASSAVERTLSILAISLVFLSGIETVAHCSALIPKIWSMLGCPDYTEIAFALVSWIATLSLIALIFLCVSFCVTEYRSMRCGI